MSKYKSVENLLYNYNMSKVNITNMELEIEYLKNNDGIKGLNYDGISTSPTNEIKSSTELSALGNMEKIQYLERMIQKAKLEIESIDRALGVLTYKERTMIELRYIKVMKWKSIENETNYAERHCRRIKNIAIKKMIIGIFGGSEDGNKNKFQ